MANDRAHEWAMEVRRDGNQSLQRAVLFAAVLIFVHLLDLRPTQIETLDVKIGLPEPSILRGALAIVFYSKFYEACANLYTANAFSKLHSERWFARSVLQRSKKKGRSHRRIKLVARMRVAGGLLFMLPYLIGLLLVFGSALVIGISDIWDLASYAWGHGLSLKIENLVDI